MARLARTGIVSRQRLKHIICAVSSCALALAAVQSGPLLGCGHGCDDVKKMSFSVSVRDAVTKASICDATVVARKGTQDFSFAASGTTTCYFYGPFEVSGDFSVNVSREGYLPASRSIEVFDDGCNVVTQLLVVELQPISANDGGVQSAADASH